MWKDKLWKLSDKKMPFYPLWKTQKSIHTPCG